MKTPILFLILALGGFALCRSVLADEPKKVGDVVRIVLPTETVVYRPGPGVEHAQQYCATCHSADYVLTQPPMPRKFWEASVKKMKEKFGAPLPEDIAPLVEYLSATYGAK